MQADVTRIVEVYHRNGRFDVQVVPKIVERPNNRIDLIFEISEGEKTGVNRSSSPAITPIRTIASKEVIKTSTSNFMSFLQTTDIYDPDRIEADRDLITALLSQLTAMPTCRWSRRPVSIDPAIKGFIITFTIEEGALYRFGRVEVRRTSRPSTRWRCSAVLRMHRGDSLQRATRSKRRSKT